MKTQLKKIQNLPKSLKTKTFLCNTTLTSCLTIALFSLMTSKAFAAGAPPIIFSDSLKYAFEGASTKELLQFLLFSFLLAVLADIKRLIKKRKLQKEEAFQVNQSTEPEEMDEAQSSAEAKETDKNENIE